MKKLLFVGLVAIVLSSCSPAIRGIVAEAPKSGNCKIIVNGKTVTTQMKSLDCLKYNTVNGKRDIGKTESKRVYVGDSVLIKNGQFIWKYLSN